MSNQAFNGRQFSEIVDTVRTIKRAWRAGEDAGNSGEISEVREYLKDQGLTPSKYNALLEEQINGNYAYQNGLYAE